MNREWLGVDSRSIQKAVGFIVQLRHRRACHRADEVDVAQLQLRGEFLECFSTRTITGNFQRRGRKSLLNDRKRSQHEVDAVVRAFAIIQLRFPDASLKVAGDGPCREALQKLAAELKLRNVDFGGPGNRDRK